MPDAAPGKIVIGFRCFVGRCGQPWRGALRRQTQGVRVEGGGQLDGATSWTDRYRGVDPRPRDLREQSNERKNKTEARSFTPPRER
jgi:hypothetical protein